MSTTNKYCIIGGGPAGLCMAKNLKELGVPFDAYEAASEVGGLWNINNERSSVYETAHLISSKKMTEFKDFPMPDDTPDYPSRRILFKYFVDYAHHFKIWEHYILNTSVEKIEKEDDKWSVTLSSGETKVYKGVLIANGTLSEPNMPQLKGNFTGEIIHSKEYKSPEIFKNKRVLIVGAGNSGCDIAVDAIHHGKSVSMSVRRGYHFVPKYVFGKPADTLGGLIKLPRKWKQKFDSFLLGWFVLDAEKYGFPKADYKLYESHPIVNSLILHHLGHGDISMKADIDQIDGKKITFKDGKSEEFDLILLSTGYKLHYPFMDQKYLNWKDGSPQLYLNAFHPDYDNLFIVGLLEATGLGWEGRNEQAKLIAHFIKAKENNSDKYKSYLEKLKKPFPDMRGGYNYLKLDRMAYYVHKDTYRNYVKKEIKFFENA